MIEVIVLSFFSGLCDGLKDATDFHAICKGSQFWDNDISWKNKYKNGDPQQGERFWGSTSLFSFVTDGWHLLKSLSKWALFVAILYGIGNTNSFLAFGIIWVSVHSGFHLLYSTDILKAITKSKIEN